MYVYWTTRQQYICRNPGVGGTANGFRVTSILRPAAPARFEFYDWNIPWNIWIILDYICTADRALFLEKDLLSWMSSKGLVYQSINVYILDLDRVKVLLYNFVCIWQ